MVVWRIKHGLRERQQLNEEIFWRISFCNGQKQTWNNLVGFLYFSVH